MRRTMTAVTTLALLGAVALTCSDGRAQSAKSHAAPEDCEWRGNAPRFRLFCHTPADPISDSEAETDRRLAEMGMVRVRPPEWNEASVPHGFDETTVDRANAGDAAAMRMVGIFHLAYGATASAVPWLRKAATAGDGEAALQLGNLYHWGLAVPHDDGQARDWFVKSAETGNVWAMHWLGELYLSGGKGLAKNEAEAARWFRPAAEAGDAAAMFRMAGLTRDAAEARNWLERSAKGGFEAAGKALKQRGLPVPAAAPVAAIDVPQGPLPECTLPAALKGAPLTQDLDDLDNERTVALMAGGMAGDKEAAFCFSRRAALRGSGYAAIDLAGTYDTNRGGPPGQAPMPSFGEGKVFKLPKDDAEAARWYALAARSKDEYIPADAMTHLGHYYASGIGLPRNDVEAVRWYQQGVALDGFTAHQALAYMYVGGFGVVRDEREAMKLLLAQIGLATNRAMYGAMIANGMAPLDPRWTADSIGLAAEAGYVEAMILLGLRFAKGDGFEKDMPAARKCLQLAASLGEPRAAAELAKLPKATADERSPEREMFANPVPECRV